jgi:hypothetical protein
MLGLFEGGVAYAGCNSPCGGATSCCSIDDYFQHDENCCSVYTQQCCTSCLFFICSAWCVDKEDWCNPFG